MSSPDIAALISDARLVLDYAIRVGRLPGDELPRAIHALETATDETVMEKLPALAAALNAATVAIRPMTLMTLRDTGNPFTGSRFVLGTMQGAFSLLTILLTLFVSITTVYLHRQETALKALEAIQQAHPVEKMNALRKMVRDIDHVSTDPVYNEQYHRAVTELRELQEKLDATSTMISNLNDVHWFGTSWFGTRSADAAVPGGNGYSAKDQKDLEQIEVSAVTAIVDPCVKQSGEDAALDHYPPWLKFVMSDSREQFCFTKNLNLLLMFPSIGSFYELKANMETLNGWVLPFLHGLLGASVFVMRNLLNPDMPPLGFFASIVRVALGGIAGIIIGWFWVPAAFVGGEAVSVSSVPFGLAFLAGFSIDMLFSLLDRLGDSVSDKARSDQAAAPAK